MLVVDRHHLDGGGGGFPGIPIGLALILIRLVSIPVTNTSVNPARPWSAAVISTSSGCSG